MSKHQPPTMEQVTSEIVEEIDPKSIILFGSRARDDHREDSDLDILVIQDRPFPAGGGRRKQMAQVWRRLAHYPLSIDLLVYTPAEIERCKGRRSHVVSRALREGRILYERS